LINNYTFAKVNVQNYTTTNIVNNIGHLLYRDLVTRKKKGKKKEKKKENQ
jgi:hypothetical protein